MAERAHMLSVWFFIGLLLTAYGIIILVTSLIDWSHPSAPAFAQYHPGVWGGIILLLIGGFYVFHFWPRPGRHE
jgi:FtsH-binding integral membrane protein